MRLLDLYRHTDPALARALEERMGLAAIARAGGMDGAAAARRRRRRRCAPISPRPPAPPPSSWRGRTGRASARSPSTAGTPMPTKARSSGRLATLLGALDGALAAIETEMGEVWRETVVAVVTEFGRTARINGTDGTDHGTATVALLAGGALKGGRVIADWPGLKPRRPARRPRPQADHRSARRAQGPAQGPPARRRRGAGRQGVPGQRRGEADGGAAGVTAQLRLLRRHDAQDSPRNCRWRARARRRALAHVADAFAEPAAGAPRLTTFSPSSSSRTSIWPRARRRTGCRARPGTDRRRRTPCRTARSTAPSA